MPEMNESEVSTTSQIRRKRSERTEAKFLEDAEKLIAEAERLGTDFKPPAGIAALASLKAKIADVLNARATDQANAAAEETTRNGRENAFKSLSADVTSLVVYAESAGLPANEIAALQALARTIKGKRAKPAGGNHISVSQMSYASRADNYAAFIEQYDALGIETDEDKYKPATHRARLAALRQANQAVIEAEAASNTSGEALDKLMYTDEDSLRNACIAAKSYILSKYGKTGQPYKNIAKTRFELPTRLRKKK